MLWRKRNPAQRGGDPFSQGPNGWRLVRAEAYLHAAAAGASPDKIDKVLEVLVGRSAV
jgi:hypothetical protein